MAMVLTAMRLTVVREVTVVVTFLLSNVYCRALLSIPSLATVKMVEIPPSLAVVELSAIELLARDGDGADGAGADGGEGGDGGDLPALQRALPRTAGHPGHGRGEDAEEPPLADGCRRAVGHGAAGSRWRWR